jgi:putative oxidoreductase
MKYLKLVPAILIGVMFLFAGLSYFFSELPPQTDANGIAFMKLFGETGYMTVIKIVELVSAVLILVPRTRALGLLISAPVVVNIFLFEMCLSHQPGPGVALLILNAIAIFLQKDKYLGILAEDSVAA